MNKRQANLHRLRAIDDLRRLGRAIKARGNHLVLITEEIEDTIPDGELPE